MYSSVGHAGASGYLAVMALFGFAPEVMKPTALTLNIVVAVIGSWQFYRTGYFSWRLFWPFALVSVPFAYFGGAVNLPVTVYKAIVGAVLLLAAIRIFAGTLKPLVESPRTPPVAIAMPVGSVLGFLSGLTGVGGGIFLTPLLLLMHWAETRQAAAASAVFILVNSISGLLGNRDNVHHLHPDILNFGAAVVVGGFLGSYFGAKKWDTTWLRRVLSLVLILAGLKLIFT